MSIVTERVTQREYRGVVDAESVTYRSVRGVLRGLHSH